MRYLLLLFLVISVAACGELPMGPTAQFNEPTPPRFNYSGGETSCINIFYGGWGATPTINGVPEGGWTAVARYLDPTSGSQVTMVQSCVFSPTDPPEWPSIECSEPSTDWHLQCYQEQLPMLDLPTISGWQPMPSAEWFDSNGGHTGVPPNPTPPDPFSVCSATDQSEDGWEDNGTGPPPDTSSAGPALCRGADALQCMQNNPGIWVGAWKIPFFGDRNIHHTAVAEVSPTRHGVTEVVGWWEYINNHVELDKPVPHYPTNDPRFSAYHWVKIAGLENLTQYRTATLRVKARYEWALYTGSSNRFVSSVLKNAGLNLTEEMRAKIGRAPGIGWCF